MPVHAPTLDYKIHSHGCSCDHDRGHDDAILTCDFLRLKQWILASGAGMQLPILIGRIKPVVSGSV